MVPAYAATMLKQDGFEVIWDDAIAEAKSYKEWFFNLTKEKPDLIAIETKTPVIKKHWRIIDEIKQSLPTTKIVLFGDHVTAMPEESLKVSQVDFLLTGGDYDFLLLNLCRYLIGGSETLEPGIWYREKGEILNTGKFVLNHDLHNLPLINRDLTNWKLYSEKNGNYKRLPGTYTMAGRDCWWGKCIFCSWVTIYPKYRLRSHESLLDEIGLLIDRYQIKEIMDDTGTFPTGKWLRDFCKGMIDRGYNKKIVFDCNMRPGILKEEDYRLMGKAGFRLILFGLESANQQTLNRINKGVREDDIVKDCEMAKRAGLEPHITVMVGYPWEDKNQVENTLRQAAYLFKQGLVDTLQATIVIPYPGTPLFEDCKRNNWLVTEDWDYYDMSEPVMKSPLSPEETKKAIQDLYKSFISPQFIARKVFSIRNLDDLRFLYRAGKALLGHIKDFMPYK
jgi:radical SAM superfamily enzyme YgiQ (UPF0313 family)